MYKITTLRSARIAAIAAAATLFLTAITAQAAFTVDLSLGSSGADVTALQTYLATDASLYPEGRVTGYFGSLTEAAVKRFQARYGIAQTGYVGPLTRAQLNTVMGASTSAGGDVWAPIMTKENVGVTTNTAQITWGTNESARSRVMYGTSYPFLYASAPSFSDPSVDSGSSVMLTGLTPSTSYYYVRESVDPSGNVMWTTKEMFRTQP